MRAENESVSDIRIMRAGQERVWVRGNKIQKFVFLRIPTKIEKEQNDY